MAFISPKRSGSAYVILMALTCLACPQQGFSDTLPWLKGNPPSSSSGSQSAQPQQPRHQVPGNPAPSMSEPYQGGGHELDDRKLNSLAMQFYNLHEKDKNAIARMRKLRGEVKNYRVSLENSGGSPDILKDAKNLEHRISRQLKQWEARKAGK